MGLKRQGHGTRDMNMGHGMLGIGVSILGKLGRKMNVRDDKDSSI